MVKNIFLGLVFLVALSVAKYASADSKDKEFYISTLNEAIKEAILDEGIRPPLKIEEVLLFSEGNSRIVTQREAERLYNWKKFSVSKLEFNDPTNRFEAELLANLDVGPTSLDQERIKSLTVKGKIVKLSQVPVLRDSMREGEVITEDDVVWIDIPAKRVLSDIVTEVKELVGLTPKYRIMAEKPIKLRELVRPVVIEKGEAVTILYSTNFMKLQALGKAMEDGKQGDTIRIENSRSKKVVRAIVKEKGIAVVSQDSIGAVVASSNF